MKGRQLTNETSTGDARTSDGQGRPVSYLRFTVRGEGVAGEPVSTLPPPPFENETDVASLEWWLEAHMSLAGGQLCVEQALDANDASAIALSSSLETLRDALYEMYCDAADPRLHDIAATDAPLGRYVRTIYVVVEDVVNFALDSDGADRKTRAGHLADAIALIPPLDGAWLAGLAIEATNPLEPLRHLSRDLAALTSALAGVAQALRAQI